MKRRTMGRTCAWLILGFLPLASCTARYQDMLRDRDATIRDLEGKLTMVRNENKELRRAKDQLLAEMDDLKAKPATVSEAAAPAEDTLGDLKRDMSRRGIKDGDVNVRWRDGKLSIGIANEVTFASGSTRISAEGRVLLKRVADVLKQRFPDNRIYVEGHTDSDPIRKTKDKYRSNRHLSAERADVVADFLVKEGRIADNRIVIVGYGPNDPVSRTDKRRNRRVEIVITG